MTAEIAAKGAFAMNTPNSEIEATEPAVATAEESKATKKATRSGGKSSVAPSKAKSKKKAKPAQKRAKSQNKTKPANAQEAAGPREGSKTAQVIALLRRKNGVTLAEIMEKMGWQTHTVRGFMAGAMKKSGYTVESFKPEGGERTYRIDQ